MSKRTSLVHVRKGSCACGNIGGLYRRVGKDAPGTLQCAVCWERHRQAQREKQRGFLDSVKADPDGVLAVYAAIVESEKKGAGE